MAKHAIKTGKPDSAIGQAHADPSFFVTRSLTPFRRLFTEVVLAPMFSILPCCLSNS